MILGKASGSRRRGTILTEHLPQLPVSPPVVEQEQQNWAESQSYHSAPPSRAGARVTSGLPARCVKCQLWTTICSSSMHSEHEYAHESEFLGATYPLARYASVHRRAELLNDLDLSLQDGRFGLPSAGAGGSTVASNPRMAPIFTLRTVSENHGALVSEDPMVGSFGLR